MKINSTLTHVVVVVTDDSVGYWRVLDHAGPNNDKKSAAQWSRVIYSTQLKVKGWVPEPIMNYLSEKALVEVRTVWKALW